MKKNLLFILMFLLGISTITAQVNFMWGKQFGSDGDEKTRGLISDSSGNVYVFGKTIGKIGDKTFGKNDGFVVKIDNAGNTVWTTQVGSIEDDELKKGTIDQSGNLYITGVIGVGENNYDILVVKINQNGKLVWQKNYGDKGIDTGEDIAVGNNGDIYLTGFTDGTMGSNAYGKNDCILLRLDNNGNQIKTVQLGTSGDDRGFGITIGMDSEIYICGATDGNLSEKNSGENDLFWSIFSEELKQTRIKQFGTNNNDYASNIKTDNIGNIYIVGNTGGDMGSEQIGGDDGFVQKWNKKGEILWTKQFGTSNWDGVHGLAIIQDKGIIVSGCQNYPDCQSFCKMYDQNGTILWKKDYVEQGEGGGTCGKGICITPQGYIYHAGYTGANLFSDLKGEHDIFLMMLKPDIE